MLTQEQKQAIVTELGKKVPTLSCPMCKTNKFVLAEGYFNNTMQANFASVALGGPSIPTAAIICENCGFVSQHALGVLGLIPKEENNKK
jgi:hypothetical protein